MAEWLSLDRIADEVFGHFARCDMAQAAGGISLRDAVDGRKIPEGWWLDQATAYYLPAGFRFEQSETRQ